MSALTSTGTELRRFRRGLLPKVAILALVLIPLLYGALYLWAFWDPTGRMTRLPVAVVDADRATTLQDGTPLHAGHDVVDQLVDDGRLGWVVTDAADAERGVRDGTYYFALTIPADFSAALASAEGESPHRATLDVTYHDANSFLASTLGHSAMVQVADAVRQTAGDQAVQTLLVGIGEAGAGLTDAADGAVTLADAAGTLSSGAGDLATGATSAADGAALLRSGSQDLADGAAALATGSRTAAHGAVDLSAGTDTLAAGLDQAQAAGATLDAGAARLSAGVDTAAAQIDALGDTLAAAPAALHDIAGYLAPRAAAGDTQAAAALAELSAVATGLGSFDPDATAAELAGLTAGAQQLAQGAAGLDAGLTRLESGAGALADGAADLADGTAELAAGAGRLAGGTTDLVDGASDLADGTRALADGAAALADGSTQLTTGASTLADALTDGAAEVPQDSDTLRTDRADVIATPVELDETHVTAADGFGEGFAPFFIPLALFVGALITWLLLRPLPTRALATPASGLRATLAGFLPAAALGLAQVAVMLTVIHLGVGLQMASSVGTVAFTVLVALAFLALQQALTALLGPAAGKVAILALLMLQLASSGGTYPVETTPAFFRVVHPLLPMSYAVTGLRELITGGVDARLWMSVAVLAGVLVGSIAVTAWRAGRMRTWTLSRLHPALAI